MGGSGGRKRLREVYPHCFNDGDIKDASKVAIVGFDAIQILRGVLALTFSTVRELAQAFLKYPIKQAKEKYPMAHTFVFVFDKYPFVPIAKGVEQQKRAKQHNEPEEYEFDFSPEARVMESWNSVTGDRDRGCPEILRAFVAEWLLDPPKERVIIDGHYLDEFQGQYNVQNVPLCLSPVPRLAHEYTNTLGEGDFGLPFLLKKLSAELHPEEDIVIHSVDSDMICIGMLLSRQIPNRIHLRFWPMLANSVNSRGHGRMDGKNVQKWCDTTLLRTSIETDDRLKAIPDPLKVMILAIYASGGDWSEPIPRAPVHHWINTVLVNASFFAKLVDEDWKIDNGSFKTFVGCATMQAIAGKRLYEHTADACLENNRMPRPDDVLYRRKHAQYALFMLRRTGKKSLKLDDSRLWGYGRENLDLPFDRKNVVRLHNSAAPQDLMTDDEQTPSRNRGDETEIGGVDLT